MNAVKIAVVQVFYGSRHIAIAANAAAPVATYQADAGPGQIIVLQIPFRLVFFNPSANLQESADASGIAAVTSPGWEGSENLRVGRSTALRAVSCLVPRIMHGLSYPALLSETKVFAMHSLHSDNPR